ncbi:hypothetical protein Cgig2_001810 [Carnegiea gigantea]|uniref:MULE transposase domain-containing protein n=1 Tax=Carnegiea gigantea TaxID=171969 RepID=A0A9Q1GQ19_9CARY|nr:hypothetical protein Cgig2_001810 [Carnegiea gigantea]
MGDTYYTVELRYRGWSISFERDRDRYQLIDLVRDANKFLNQPHVDTKPKFFGLSSHSPQKVRLKWPINTDDDLLKVFDMWKDVIIELQENYDEGDCDEEEFEMEYEEQSESESSDLASVVDDDEIFDSDSDKSTFLDVIRDYMVQEGIYFKIIKNELCRYTAKCEENEGSRLIFQRIFVCFRACKKGFLARCRKFIGVDGTHLKGVYKGVLLTAMGMLTAMGIDAQNHYVPLAYAVVDIENKDNWSYFFNYLRGIIGDGSGSEHTLIADR